MLNIQYRLQAETLVCADLYPYVDRVYMMYIALWKRVLFCFPILPRLGSIRRDFKVYDKNIICNHLVCDFADL